MNGLIQMLNEAGLIIGVLRQEDGKLRDTISQQAERINELQAAAENSKPPVKSVIKETS